jgi:KUP system potassium uptake protein
VRFGFAQHPALPLVLTAHAAQLSIQIEDASFFVGRETPVPTTRPDLALWRERLFIL